MTKWILQVILIVAWGCSTTAIAQDKIVSRVEKKSIHFFYRSCEEECQVATLICDDGGTVSVQLADINAQNAAKAITEPKKQMVLKVGKKSFEFVITEMDFMEMTVSWWLTAIPDGVNMRELAPAIATAKVIEAQAGGQKVTLPIDAGVKAWAVGCK